MPLVRKLPVPCRGLSPQSTVAAIIAHVTGIVVVVDHRRIDIGVADVRRTDVVGRAIVGELITLPATAAVAFPAVAVAVINAAIEADIRSPVSGVENKRTAAPTPIGGSPKHPDLRRLHPGSRHPVVTIFAIGPKAGSPQVTLTRAIGLDIDRQRRRRDRNGKRDLGKSGRASQGKGQNKQALRREVAGEGFHSPPLDL